MRCDLQPDLGTVRGACPVDSSLAQLRAAAARSCGRDVMCREGTRQLMTVLDDVVAGRTQPGDLDLITDLAQVVAQQASCEMTGGAAQRLVGSLRDEADEWDQHLRRKRCTSLTCAMSFTVYADPETCTGCQACSPLCPVGAIAGGEDLVHVVDAAACTKCLLCLPACPVGALRKAGPVKPRLPSEPVPVGSLADAGAGGGMRRRRRGA